MTDLGFDGRVAVVTGAGGGLGREYALLLASRGARVVVNDTGGSTTGEGTDQGPAESVAREIRDEGGEALADTNSVATPEGGQAVVRTALDAYGRLDVVVNNAGILRDAPFHDMTADLLDPVLDVHLRGAFFVTRPAWDVMRERGYGRVVNTISAAGVLGTAGKSNYGAAKTGLIGLTRVLAAEGAMHGIKVNAVAPIALTRMLTQSLTKTGATRTEATKISAERKADPTAQAMTVERMRSFVDRLDPALVAPVVAYLVHEDCPVSGEMYTVGAGHVSRFFIGRTNGYFNRALSMEDVRDHFAEIRDETGYTVPRDPADETGQLFRTVHD
ncbi:SDR family NAD(P)-dependent oxidoreductase [Streptomyces sp. GLT-R25]